MLSTKLTQDFKLSLRYQPYHNKCPGRLLFPPPLFFTARVPSLSNAFWQAILKGQRRHSASALSGQCYFSARAR